MKKGHNEKLTADLTFNGETLGQEEEKMVSTLTFIQHYTGGLVYSVRQEREIGMHT